MKQDLKSMTLAEMQDAFAAIGKPKFRAKQVFTWLHRGAVSFDAMTNLSKPLREKLDGLYYITAPSVARKQVSKLDGTIKYLWKLRDGNCVESVGAGRSGALFPARFRPADLQHRAHGHRRAAG